MEERRNQNLIPLVLLASVILVALGLIFVFARAYWDEGVPDPTKTPFSRSAPSVEEQIIPATGELPTVPPVDVEQPGSNTSASADTAVPTVQPAQSPSEQDEPSGTVTPDSPASAGGVEELLASLTLEQKIGQMIMDTLPGDVSDPQTRQRIITDGLGGVIFLNVQSSPDQLRQTTQQLQQMATQEGTGIPLFFAWNHEGGRISRHSVGVTEFPSNMALGATGQQQLARAYGQAVGEEMYSLGINMNYAPVLDVNTEPANPIIGLRAFGDDPTTVASMGTAYIEGLQEAGVIAVAKHYPGHGGVDIDSHLDLPLVTASQAEIAQTDLPPFDAALKSNVGAVMVAHLQIPAIDPSGRPSSLSSAAVNDILRQQMGFNGLIMTDAIGMGAITDQYGIGEAAVMAVEAGNDMVLAVSPGEFEAVRDGLLSAVGTGRLNEARIDDSVRRILELKLAYDLVPSPETPVLANQDVHWNLANQIADQAVRIDPQHGQWLPLNLPTGRMLLITPNKLAERHAGTTVGDGRSALNELFGSRGIEVSELFYDHDSPASILEAQNAALARAQTVDAVVVITWDADLQQYHTGATAQPQMINSLLQTGTPVIVVYGQLPYDSALTPDVPAQVTMYGDTVAQLSALVSRLLQ